MNLNFLSQFYGNFGIAIHARELAKAMIKHNHDCFLDFQPNSICYCGINLSQFLAQKDPIGITTEMLPHFYGHIDQEYPSLTFWYPNSYKRINKKKNIGYYVFEYDLIPQDYISSINNNLDIICTPSNWGVEVLKENGVKIPVKLLQGGIDTYRFKIDREKNLTDRNVLRFLHIGKLEERKGTELLVRAFLETFRGDSSVSLDLMIDNPHVPDFNALKWLKSVENQYPDIKNTNIRIKPPIDNILEAYKNCDVAIFPSLAEGLGLPILEAMACELPVITCFNSGITQYATDDNCLLLRDLEIVPVYDPLFFPTEGQFGFWNKPNKEDIGSKMLYCYNDFFQNDGKELKELGKRARQDVSSTMNWNITINQLGEILN